MCLPIRLEIEEFNVSVCRQVSEKQNCDFSPNKQFKGVLCIASLGKLPASPEYISHRGQIAYFPDTSGGIGSGSFEDNGVNDPLHCLSKKD